MTEAEWLASNDPEGMLAWLLETHPGLGEPRPRRPSDRKLRLFAVAVARSQPSWASWRADSPPKAYAAEIEALLERGEANYDRPASNARARDLGLYFAMASAREAAELEARHAPGSAVVAAAILRDVVGNPFRPVTLPYTAVGRGLVVPDAAKNRPSPRLAAAGFEQYCPWITPTVLSLAEAAYSERGRECEKCKGKKRFWINGGPYESGWEDCESCHGTGRTDGGTLDPHRLLVLADALEEAGCEPEHKQQCPACDGMGGYNEMGPNTFWQTCGRCDGLRYVMISNPLLAHLRGPGPHVRGCWAIDCVTGRG